MLVALARDKKYRGVCAPGSPCKSLNLASATFDWREKPGSPGNTARIEAKYEVVELESAFRKKYETDAHYVGYILYQGGQPLSRQPRLNKNAIPWVYSQGFQIYYTLFSGDWDNPNHIPWDKGPRDLFQKSLEIWAHNLWLTHVGSYYSRAGQRILQPIHPYLPMFCVERPIAQWIEEARAHEIPLDLACKDATRHFRAPSVFRDEQQSAIHPDFFSMKTRNFDEWTRVPRFHPDTMEVYGEFGRAQIELAVNRYGWEDPKERAPARMRKPRPLGEWIAEAPEEHKPLCEKLGKAYQALALGQRHRAYLYLAGALIHKKISHEIVPSLIRFVASVAGHDAEHHGRSAEDTAAKHAAGNAVTGIGPLTKECPEVVAILQQTSHVVSTTEAQPLLKAREKIYDEIRFAEYGITFVAAECGIGKTRVTMEVARDQVREANLSPHTRFPTSAKMVIVCDKNSLAIQTMETLQDTYEVPVKRLFGPASLRDAKGNPICKYYDSMVAIANAGLSVPKIGCRGGGKLPCEYLETCEAAKGWEGEEEAPIVTTTHALVKRALAEVGKDTPLTIDEPPSALKDFILTEKDLALALKNLEAFESRYAQAMAPLVHMMQQWLAKNEPGTTAWSLTDIARVAGHFVPMDLLRTAMIVTNLALMDTAGLDAIECAKLAPSEDSKDAIPPIRKDHILQVRKNSIRARVVGKTAMVLGSLQETAASLEAPKPSLIRVEEVKDVKRLRIVCPNHEFRMALLHQVRSVILDATPEVQVPAIEALTGRKVTVKRFVVADGAPIARTILPYRSATRTTWLTPWGMPLWENGILRALRRCLEIFRGSKDVCVITFLPIAVALRVVVDPEETRWPAMWGEANLGLSMASLETAKRLLEPVVALHPGTWTIGHYGATRGMNTAEHVDALATLGDPWPNLEAAQMWASYLDLLEERYVDLHAIAELTQSQGRLRAPSRTTPAKAVHVGTVIPSAYGWDRAVRLEADHGHGHAVDAMSPLEFASLRTKLGLTQAELATSFQVSRGLIAKYETGLRAVTPGIAMALRQRSNGTSVQSAHV